MTTYWLRMVDGEEIEISIDMEEEELAEHVAKGHVLKVPESSVPQDRSYINTGLIKEFWVQEE